MAPIRIAWGKAVDDGTRHPAANPISTNNTLWLMSQHQKCVLSFIWGEEKAFFQMFWFLHLDGFSKDFRIMSLKRRLFMVWQRWKTRQQSSEKFLHLHVCTTKVSYTHWFVLKGRGGWLSSSKAHSRRWTTTAKRESDGEREKEEISFWALPRLCAAWRLQCGLRTKKRDCFLPTGHCSRQIRFRDLCGSSALLDYYTTTNAVIMIRFLWTVILFYVVETFLGVLYYTILSL